MCQSTNDKTRQSLSKHEAMELADFAVEHQFNTVEISGGEPLILDYIFDILERLSGEIPLIRLITNGSLIKDVDIKKLKRYPNLLVTVSLHGVGEIHNTIVGKKNIFNKADDALREMTKSGIRTSINSVIQALNYQQIYEIFDYFSDIAYEWHGFTPVEPLYPLIPEEIVMPKSKSAWILEEVQRVKESSLKKKKSLALFSDLFAGYNEVINACIGDVEVGEITHSGFMCSVPRRLISVNWKADVYPCFHHNWAKYEVNMNFRHYDSFKGFVMSRAYKEMITKGTGIFGCKGCNTRCYIWDEDFKRKVNSPTFMEKLFPKIMDAERKKLLEEAPMLQSNFDATPMISQNWKRSVYIWGGGRGGIYAYRSLHARGISISGLVDNNPDKWGTKIEGYEIFAPSILKKCEEEKTRPYVIIGSQFTTEISLQLNKLGYSKIRDFQALTIP